MANKLAVWNQALVHLEKEGLASLTSEMEARYVFERAWPGVVEEAFNEGDWNFAKVSAALVLNVVETAAVGWTYVFDYPEDYIRTVAVSNVPDFQQEFFNYIDQGGFIHANQNVMYLRYISSAMMTVDDDDDDLPWPTLFWRYVALKLAYETCGKLTGGASLRDDLEKRKEKALRQAKSVDARNENNKIDRPGSWLRARRGFYGYGNRLGNTIVGGEIVPDEGDV
ncbi:hypothetical protein J2X76_003681 [Neorhizobium sp. 2083]|uniref:hypothetical protein n=1 Tax=Neorhizobium sp. 2083 TaxID=2817762 RepID=UPI00286419D9|nr:hypothetical protein [Neorhizobium sp. 2083]MDR6818504.1 hypothetical protein [Neorhizobium sp. 2083]